MARIVGGEALKPNPALKPFEVLVGEWKTEGSHPYFPGTVLHGRTSFEWIEGGAFLLERSELDNPEFPNGVAIFGSDDEAKKYHMIYFDSRGISRLYKCSIKDNVLTWQRDEAGFAQRMALTVSSDGNKMVGKGEMRRDGKTWEGDLSLTYTRELKT